MKTMLALSIYMACFQPDEPPSPFLHFTLSLVRLALHAGFFVFDLPMSRSPASVQPLPPRKRYLAAKLKDTNNAAEPEIRMHQRDTRPSSAVPGDHKSCPPSHNGTPKASSSARHSQAPASQTILGVLALSDSIDLRIRPWPVDGPANVLIEELLTLFAGKRRPKATVEEVPDEELSGSQYHVSDLEPEVPSGEPEVSGGDESDDTVPLCPKSTCSDKRKKGKTSKKRRKASPPDNDVIDADIEMVDVDEGPLKVDDDPIKDIKHFFSEPFLKEGQKFRSCWVCP